MGFCMTETLARLLLRLSEAGEPTILWGRQAKPYLGREFDRLLDRGLLVEQAPAEEWDVCIDCECGLDQRQIQRIDGSLVAACPFDHAKDARIEPEDVRSFTIDCPGLIHEIARASGFEDPSEIAPGVWHLGATVSQREFFFALSRQAVLQLGLIGAVRSFARSSPTTLISPNVSAADKTRLIEAGIRLLSTQECLARDGAAGGFAIDFSKFDSCRRELRRAL